MLKPTFHPLPHPISPRIGRSAQLSRHTYISGVDVTWAWFRIRRRLSCGIKETPKCSHCTRRMFWRANQVTHRCWDNSPKRLRVCTYEKKNGGKWLIENQWLAWLWSRFMMDNIFWCNGSYVSLGWIIHARGLSDVMLDAARRNETRRGDCERLWPRYWFLQPTQLPCWSSKNITF